MPGSRRISPGDVYWIDPDPVAGREMKDRHPFVVITPREINRLGVAMTVPLTTGGLFARGLGLTVEVAGESIRGFAVCNQVRAFDLETRVRAGSARYVETLGEATTNEIISRVLSVIDPEGA
jgi:mRNA interferase ChpB